MNCVHTILRDNRHQFNMGSPCAYQASSELIKALADQNTQLVNRIELNRVRLQRASIVAASLGALLLSAVGYLLLRQ